MFRERFEFEQVMDRLQDRFALKVSKIYARNVYREPEGQGESCLQFCVKFTIMVDNQFKDKLQ